jgi:hypothetical protein
VKKRLIILGIILTVIVITAVILYFALGGTTENVAAQTLPQPPTVAQVAGFLHATYPTPCTGANPIVGIVNSGVAWVGHEKIGIDVFQNSTVRNSWKTMSADYGVSPFAQGPQWVAYKALSQTGGLCS